MMFEKVILSVFVVCVLVITSDVSINVGLKIISDLIGQRMVVDRHLREFWESFPALG